MGRPRTKKQDDIRKGIILDPEYQYLLQDSGKLWCVSNNKDKTMYRIWYRVEKKYLHRWIIGAKKGEIVDHINGNPLDNRKCNLRIATAGQNAWNSVGHKDKLFSKYKGVSFFRYKQYKRSKPWTAIIMFKGKSYKKYFRTEIEAAEQYNKWALELFGEFAVLNIITKDV